LNTSSDQPKVIPFSKIQQACKNAAYKFKKINLVSDKTPLAKKSRNPMETSNLSGKTVEISSQLGTSQALLHQSRSF
jgi:hypothetical protein